MKKIKRFISFLMIMAILVSTGFHNNTVAFANPWLVPTNFNQIAGSWALRETSTGTQSGLNVVFYFNGTGQYLRWDNSNHWDDAGKYVLEPNATNLNGEGLYGFSSNGLVATLALAPQGGSAPNETGELWISNDGNTLRIHLPSMGTRIFDKKDIRPTVELNGRLVNFTDQRPIINPDSVLIPIRDVLIALGYVSSWDDVTETAVFSNGVNTVMIMRDSAHYLINGKSYYFPSPARTVNSRLMVPYKDVLEKVGCYVTWNSTNSKVSVTY